MGLENGIKKTLLAGVGAVATTAEAAKQVVDTLAQKGEEAMEQGKAMKDTVKEAMKEAKENMQQQKSEDASDTGHTGTF